MNAIKSRANLVMLYSLASPVALSAGILRCTGVSNGAYRDLLTAARREGTEIKTHQVPLSFFDSSCSRPAALVSPYRFRLPLLIQAISAASDSSVACGNAARKRDEADTAPVSKRLMMCLCEQAGACQQSFSREIGRVFVCSSGARDHSEKG